MNPYIKIVCGGIICILMFVSNLIVIAQNVGFSQYHYTPNLTNPATVSTKSEMGSLFNFRRQTIAAGLNYTTPMVSFIYPFINKKEKMRWGGTGISVLNEVNGQNNFFRTTAVLAGLGYNLPVAENHYFSFGMQGGYYQRVIDLDNAKTEEYYLNGLDPNNIGENIASFRDGFPVINSGIIFYKEDNNQQIPYQVGVSLYNINRPDVSFFNQIDRIPMSIQVSGEFQAFSNEYISIHPTFRWWQRTQVNQLNVGSIFKYHFETLGNTNFFKQGHIGAGVWYNLNNVVIMSVQIEQPAYVFSFSYDFASSNKIPTKETNNAFEFTLGWRKIFDTRKTKRIRPIKNIPPVKDVSVYNTEKVENTVEKDKGTTVIIRKPIEIIAPKKQVVVSETDKSILSEIISFSNQSVELSDNAERHLNEVAQLLEQYPDFLLKFSGYYTTGENHTLALNRATIIKNYLVRRGIEANRLILEDMGNKKNASEVDVTILR